jgi:predicted ATPase/DNA-binding SARP family transcriptional activator
MEFRVLGPLVVIDRGTPVRLSARRQRALVAALLLRRGEALSRDALIDAIWGNDAPGSAASVLRLYVSQIRRVLPPERLVTGRPGYALLVEPGELDAERFEELLADGRRARAEGNARLARALCVRALDLWRGAALADLADEPFAHEEANRLDELRVECLEERLEADLEVGRHGEVLAELERLVAEHPLRERMRGQLILALYRAGRQAEALACYRAGREALVTELGLEPGTELRDLERRILRQDPSLEPVPTTVLPARRSQVPSPATVTIGREREIAEVRRLLLSQPTRLVTLLGPGGVGKSRLAVESAAIMGVELADGAVVVELASLRDHDLLLPSIGHALGLRDTAGLSWTELLGEHLRPLELLLVLDNLEHLVAGVAPLGELLAVAPRLRLLATSRTVLRLAAEQVLEVLPLDRAAAVELFVRQTIAAGVAASTVSASRAVIEQICERLDGSPLAIELAAPRLRVLPPAELLRLLDSRLDALRDGPRDAPARHQTLRSTIDWSFDLLSPDVQRLFARLSVFSGGFTVDAMIALGEPDATIGGLEALVDASLVQVRDGRHHVLAVVREYAAERLGNDLEPHRRHADHFAQLAVTAARELSGTNQTNWLRILDAEHDNLRAALDWLAADDDAPAELRLAATLGRFWYVRGYIEEGLRRLRHAIDRAAGRDEPALAKALRAASALALIRGDYPLARELADRALSLYRSLDDRAGVARTLSNLGAILHAQNELDLAAATLDECILDCAKLGDDRLLALAQNNRGDVALSLHDLDAAAAHFERSLDILRVFGDTANVARALYNLGAVAVEQERVDDARTLLGESIALANNVGDSEDVAWCLIALAAVSAHTRQPLDGVRMLGFTTALLGRIGATMKPFEQNLYTRTHQTLHSALGDHAFEDALDDGARLQLADIIELATRMSPPLAT